MSEFIDHLKLTLRAGRGGRGCVSFRREKYVPRGGPNGGNGGRGGHVILQASSQLSTLSHLRPNALIKAGRGEHGGSNRKTGAEGRDVIVKVPVGTVIRDHSSSEFIADLVEDGQELIVARGGRGGLGNAAFAKPTQQAPKFAQPGEEGEEKEISLELKLLADVGIIGLPNAGKSTLLSRISPARPEIADYPFTTLYPVLGVVNLGYDQFVVADIPGLIEGAHKGLGLGHQFLRHIERTRVLLHLVDIGSPDVEKPQRQIDILEKELRMFQTALADKPKLVVGNKIDLQPARERIESIKKVADENRLKLCLISSATGEGIDTMLREIHNLLGKTSQSD